MSGHADTIIEAFDRLLAQDSWQEPYVKAAGESLDALLAENQRLRETGTASPVDCSDLTRTGNPSESTFTYKGDT